MDKKIKTTLFFALTAASITLGGCGGAVATDQQEKAVAEVVSIPVEAVTIEMGSIQSNYTSSAILEAQQEAFVVARASGIIEQILVEEGDYVEKGQVLAQLDKRRYELALEKARADLAGIDQELKKINKVYSKKLISDDAFEKLSAQYDSANANVELAELDLKETTITAPISGYIAERNAKVGNLTESFQRERMFHIVQQRTLQGIVYLPESELTNIHPQQQAVLTLPALKNRQVIAHVERISPVVDATTGTFKVTLKVPNEDDALKAGMFSEVAINYATREHTKLLPRQALVSIDNSASVFVIRDGIANKVDVTLGFEDGDKVEVLTGLTGNETVVTVGHQNIKDQTPVEIVNS